MHTIKFKSKYLSTLYDTSLSTVDDINKSKNINNVSECINIEMYMNDLVSKKDGVCKCDALIAIDRKITLIEFKTAILSDKESLKYMSEGKTRNCKIFRKFKETTEIINKEFNISHNINFIIGFDRPLLTKQRSQAITIKAAFREEGKEVALKDFEEINKLSPDRIKKKDEYLELEYLLFNDIIEE